MYYTTLKHHDKQLQQTWTTPSNPRGLLLLFNAADYPMRGDDAFWMIYNK